MLLSLNMLLLGLLVEIMLQLVSIPNRGQIVVSQRNRIKKETIQNECPQDVLHIGCNLDNGFMC